MKTSSIDQKPALDNSSDQNFDEVETIYSGQRPQFQQSANKPQKTLSTHPKHTKDFWE